MALTPGKNLDPLEVFSGFACQSMAHDAASASKGSSL